MGHHPDPSLDARDDTGALTSITVNHIEFNPLAGLQSSHIPMTDLPATPRTSIDFARPFTFVFEDPQWPVKIVIGGLFYIAAMFIVGIFFILGYLARMTRNIVAGNPRPLPDWNDLGEYFTEGFMLAMVALVYTLPIFLLVGVLVIPVVLLEGRSGQEAANMMASCLVMAVVPLSLLASLIIPAALVRGMAENRPFAGLEVGKVIRFIRENLTNYLLAVMIYILSSVLSQLGVILVCVGVFFTAFWAQVVSTAAFADAYRLAVRK